MEHDSSERHRCIAFDSSRAIPRGWAGSIRGRGPQEHLKINLGAFMFHTIAQRDNENRSQREASGLSREVSFDDYLGLCDFRFPSSCTLHVDGVCLENGWKCVSPGLCVSPPCGPSSNSSGTPIPDPLPFHSAISISIPNSRQLPIVYLFLQLVVDFLSGLVELPPPSPFAPSPPRIHQLPHYLDLEPGHSTEAYSIRTGPNQLETFLGHCDRRHYISASF